MITDAWLLVIVLAVIILVFALFKRPMYEAMFAGFIAAVAFSGQFAKTFDFLKTAVAKKETFIIAGFLLFSAVLSKSGVIQDIIDIILSLVSKLPGGAGLVSIFSCTFMGALSGSIVGNVAATGSITIPLMKKSGYSPEFSAGVCMSGSCLSPIIPPSTTIPIALAALVLVPGFEEFTQGDFLKAMYGVALWMVLQRILQFYLMYKLYGIRKTESVDVPKVGEAFKKGWKSLLLIIVILLPFLVDAIWSEQLAELCGKDAAKLFSDSVLLITPALGTLYCALISRDKEMRKPSKLAETFAGSMKTIAPMVAMMLFSYAISAVLTSTGTMDGITAALQTAGLSKLLTVLIILVVATLLGMFMPGTSLIPLFGTICIVVMQGYGVNPVAIAAILPALFVSLGQMTPPFAPGLYAAMAIADSDFKKTTMHSVWWALGQLVVIFLIMMGYLPVLGA